jgi:hypothetical protein
MVKRIPKIEKVPGQVRILGKDYEIKVFEDFEDCGQCDDLKQTIKLQANMPMTLEQDTLLHEVIHALDFNMKTSMKERQVSALASGLIAVFRDNPHFVSYLFQQPPPKHANKTKNK